MPSYSRNTAHGVASAFSSIAVLTGGVSAVAPERRAEAARYGLRVMLAATLSNLMSAIIAGMFLTLKRRKS